MQQLKRITPVQLPIWPDAVRGGPNVLLRSAFFAAIASKQRRVLEIRSSPDQEPEGIVISAQDGVTIKYTGTQLNQYDADVFFEVLHRSRRSALGNDALFSGAEFLSSIGRSRNNLNYADLDTSLRRLKRGVVDVSWRIKERRYVYTGSLVDSYVRETDSKLYKVSLSPQMQTLFTPGSWSHLQWTERLRLIRAPLAQWLHGYYSTHANAYPVTVAFLQEKTGHASSRRDHFIVTLRRALALLEKELKWQVEWTGDSISVSYTPSESQTRYLEREKVRKTQRAALAAPQSPRRKASTALDELLARRSM